ncbi:MAG: thymidine kinase [Lachnospiraceae bacterium]|nr:thymidine kinase [Lachnospiraceae bacterium]MBR3807668.1 thymidine kinase [Lachnospiraceae bacterium]
MAKLYFKYGAMGSSKSAQALITKFNYEERGMKVWLLKPATDNRNGVEVIQSRIGLREEADALKPEGSVLSRFKALKQVDVVITDESQFFTEEQIDDLRYIVDNYDIPVLCFGLRTDFRTKLFPGSLRLFEVADSISEIKTICSCGNKAIVNARINSEGKVLSEGEQVFIGGNESYIAMCHKCWKKALQEQEN